jgi:3-oxoacyl-[acyl-carrier-protein] synthase III
MRRSSMKVGLEALTSYFPDKVVKREDFKYLDPVIPKDLEWVFRGPDERRSFEGDDAVEVMGEKVVRKVLDSAGLAASDIDFIIAGNLGGKYVVPMVGSYIHFKVGFPREVPAVNIQTCCASFVDAFNLAWSLVLSGAYKRVLVVMVTATTISGLRTDPTHPTAKLFGDGAGAAIVSSQNLKCEFLSYANRTFGELYPHMTVRSKPLENPEILQEAGKKFGNFLEADEWFFGWQQEQGKRFAVDGVEQALKKANLTFADVDYIVLHQAQDIIQEPWIAGGEEVGLTRDQWKETWNKYANVGNVDIAPNLEELWHEGKLHNGSIIALFPPGLGGHTPSMILRWLV